MGCPASSAAGKRPPDDADLNHDVIMLMPDSAPASHDARDQALLYVAATTCPEDAHGAPIQLKAR
jgi:hypothetical protein